MQIFIKLLQLQEMIEAIGAQMKQNEQRAESRIPATDNAPIISESFRQENQRAVDYDPSDAEAANGAGQ